MAASYPTSIKSFTTKVDNVDDYMAAHINDLQAEVAAIETDLLTGGFLSKLLHVRDEKSAGTSGGTFTDGAWRTRDLNTVKTNEITGASLASNQITLPAGTYFIQARCPCNAVNQNIAKLKNITAGTDLIIGSAGMSIWNSAVVTDSIVQGRFTLASQSVLELQHYGLYAGTFGTAANIGVVEVYTEVQIWKVA